MVLKILLKIISFSLKREPCPDCGVSVRGTGLTERVIDLCAFRALRRLSESEAGIDFILMQTIGCFS